MNQESQIQKDRVENSIRIKLDDLMEILVVVNAGAHVLVKAKPKFEDDEEGGGE